MMVHDNDTNGPDGPSSPTADRSAGAATGTPRSAELLRHSESAVIGVACEGLVQRYRRVRALDGLDLTVPPGVAVGLVGRNGAGKSTLFRAILGIEALRRGCTRALPVAMPHREFLARTGFVPDQLSAYDWMTVGGMIEHAAQLQPRFDRQWTEELRRRLALDPSKPIRGLSRGMQARLAFLLGLAHRPGLLLLDEPFLGVDAVSHDILLSAIARLRSDTGCSVLMASHGLGDIARITDRIAFMEAGRVVEELSTEELVSDTKRLVVRPEPASFVPPPEAVHVARGDGAVVVTVRNFTRELVERLRAGIPGGHVDVIDLTIAEACTDRMRALEAMS